VHQNLNKVRLLEQKQLNIHTNIVHQVGLEFDVDFKNRLKNYHFVAQIWDTLYTDGLSRNKVYAIFFYKMKI